LAPRIGATIPARRNALSTARPTMLGHGKAVTNQLLF
jgi:hypothetical protein